MKTVLILSGGLDSTTLLYYMSRQGDEVHALSFIYGQKHIKELQCAVYQSREAGAHHEVINLSMLAPIFKGSALTTESVAIPDVEEVLGDPQPSTYVPNRNTIFLALAVGYAEAIGSSFVAYGAQKHDVYGYWDTTPQYLQRTQELYMLNRKDRIFVEAPFVKYSKAEVLKIGLEMQIDYSQTWSCYAGRNKACGKCPTCSERLKAFADLGLTDPLEYEV